MAELVLPTDEERRGRYGDRFRREREAVSLTQRQVAEAIDVDQKIVSRAERGNASDGTFAALERLFEIPDPYPSAPKDPVRRMAWVRERAERIGGARPPASGTFGRGEVPKGVGS